VTDEKVLVRCDGLTDCDRGVGDGVATDDIIPAGIEMKAGHRAAHAAFVDIYNRARDARIAL